MPVKHYLPFNTLTEEVKKTHVRNVRKELDRIRQAKQRSGAPQPGRRAVGVAMPAPEPPSCTP